MAEMETMLAMESLVSCSPSRTLILEVDPPAVQWAAVRMCWLEMRDPPHQGDLPLEDTSPTCQGYSLTSVSWPPTILVPLFTWPQLHEEDDSVVVVGASVDGVDGLVPSVGSIVGASVSSVVPVPDPSKSPEPEMIHLGKQNIYLIWTKTFLKNLPESSCIPPSS